MDDLGSSLEVVGVIINSINLILVECLVLLLNWDDCLPGNGLGWDWLPLLYKFVGWIVSLNGMDGLGMVKVVLGLLREVWLRI